MALICVDSACEAIEESGLLYSVVAETGHRSELGDELLGGAQFGLDLELVDLVEMGGEVLDEFGSFLFVEVGQQRSDPIEIALGGRRCVGCVHSVPPLRRAAGPSQR